jgi:hypothetical protein
MKKDKSRIKARTDSLSANARQKEAYEKSRYDGSDQGESEA